MDSRFRSAFNHAFSQDLYEQYSLDLSRRLDVRFEYRLAESPVFIPDDLRQKCERAAREIVADLSDRGRISRMLQAVPDRWRVPQMDALPHFAQVDFAIVRNREGLLEPRLIELQGFPSLAAFQVFQRDSWNDVMSRLPGLAENWSCWFSGLDRARFIELFRRCVLGRHDPGSVVLMDIDPETQKTFPDFRATERLLGVPYVCPTKVVREGRRLFHKDSAGRLIRIERVYNRVVFDELIQKRIELPFDFRDELDVEWSPNPNWYWIWSKNSMPLLNHPSVPRAILLSELETVPDDLTGFVLKPLFSFAGGGVNVEPCAADLQAIRESDRPNWCLQEKIDYAPALESVDGGGVKVEMRMMFFRPDEEPVMTLGENLCRLSRGKMMGVDYNRDFSWVGSSIGLWPQTES